MLTSIYLVFQTQAGMYELLMEMSSKQTQGNENTSRLEEQLSTIQVSVLEEEAPRPVQYSGLKAVLG